jgi:gamma-polyglutamate biosynthesis protein CapC
MVEPVILAIGTGLLVNLLMGEFFGLIAGGMVVTGYIALSLDLPMDVALTLVAAGITFLIVRGLSVLVILYGRRTFAAMVLVGFLVCVSMNLALASVAPSAPAISARLVPGIGAPGLYRTIGFIIPGLIALWMERQGVFVTVCSLLIGASVVRLLLVLLIGTQISPTAGVYF